MSPTGDAVAGPAGDPPWRRRHRLVTAVLADAGTGRLDAAGLVAVEIEFGCLDRFLLFLHHRWWNGFDAHLDAVLEEPGGDLADAVRALWCARDACEPAVRSLLDAYGARAAVAAAEQARRDRLRRVLGVDVRDGAYCDPAATSVAVIGSSSVVSSSSSAGESAS